MKSSSCQRVPTATTRYGGSRRVKMSARHLSHSRSRIRLEWAVTKSFTMSSRMRTLKPRPVTDEPTDRATRPPPSARVQRLDAPWSRTILIPRCGFSSMILRACDAHEFTSVSSWESMPIFHDGRVRWSQIGVYREERIDLPMRGGIDTVRSRFWPASTSRTAFASRSDRYFRCGRGAYRWSSSRACSRGVCGRPSASTPSVLVRASSTCGGMDSANSMICSSVRPRRSSSDTARLDGCALLPRRGHFLPRERRADRGPDGDDHERQDGREQKGAQLPLPGRPDDVAVDGGREADGEPGGDRPEGRARVPRLAEDRRDRDQEGGRPESGVDQEQVEQGQARHERDGDGDGGSDADDDALALQVRGVVAGEGAERDEHGVGGRQQRREDREQEGDEEPVGQERGGHVQVDVVRGGRGGDALSGADVAEDAHADGDEHEGGGGDEEGGLDRTRLVGVGPLPERRVAHGPGHEPDGGHDAEGEGDHL